MTSVYNWNNLAKFENAQLNRNSQTVLLTSGLVGWREIHATAAALDLSSICDPDSPPCSVFFSGVSKVTLLMLERVTEDLD